MPIIESCYTPPPWGRSAHMQTIYPTLFRRISLPSYQRQEFELPDNDFLDIDWLATGSRRLAILLHGLEGSSEAHYISALSHQFMHYHWDTAAINQRGCSGRPNRQLPAYHSGKTEDLKVVIENIIAKKTYEEIFIVGISMGGNITLKYLGENGANLPHEITGACAISTPCCLNTAAEAMCKPSNTIYMRRFLRSFRRKLVEKQKIYPNDIDLTGFHRINNFQQFDNRYTAPWHDFRDATDYYTKSSCLPVLDNIKRPTLIVNSKDDPFLSAECYPIKAAQRNPHLYLMMPNYGGHVGFVASKQKQLYWHESQAVRFAQATSTLSNQQNLKVIKTEALAQFSP